MNTSATGIQPPHGDEDAATGAIFEQIGLASQTDYLRLRRLAKAVAANGGLISDEDLEWAIKAVKNAMEVAFRSYVMIVLAEVGNATPLPASQKAAILAAVDPYLSSPNKLDQMSVLHVRSWLEGG